MDNAPRRTGRGRQAEAARNDMTVLDAARLVLAIHGPDAPVALIAQTAEVGVGTLYRRYSSKEHLVEHLCRLSLDEQIAEAHRAASVDDPWVALAGFIERCVERRVGAFGALAGTFTPGPSLIATARQVHEALEGLVRAARDTAALRPDVTSVDIHNLISLFSHRPAGQEEAHSRLLSVALAGLRTAEGDLVHAPDHWEGYESVWGA